jgi:hypothetical protein
MDRMTGQASAWAATQRQRARAGSSGGTPLAMAISRQLLNSSRLSPAKFTAMTRTAHSCSLRRGQGEFFNEIGRRRAFEQLPVDANHREGWHNIPRILVRHHLLFATHWG